MRISNPVKRVADFALFIPRKIVGPFKEARLRRKMEAERVTSEPVFDDGISQSEFIALVDEAQKSIPRIVDTRIDDLIVRLKIKSISGLTIWNATVDFNDFGHLSGWYKIKSENAKSNVPEAFAREMCELMEKIRKSNEK